MTDERIIDLYLERAEEAVRETQTKYGTRLNRIAENIVHDRDTADECENDTYLRTWNMIPPQEPRTYLFSFLAKITRNLALDVLRREQAAKRDPGVLVELTKELEEILPGKESMVEESVLEQELTATINRFLGGLSAEQRILFVRRYWYGISVKELASLMGFSESKVKSALFQLRKKLKAYLEKEGYEL